MGKYFGTDGFRGQAGVMLTADHAYRIGRFLGWYCREHDLGDSSPIPCHRPRLAVGKDTRLSGYMLEYALAAGLAASGADPYMLHVTTTPCVSFVTAGEDFDGGVMISASHNPFGDNGIKLVNRHGEKIGDDTIAVIEAYLDGDEELPFATGADVGRIVDHAAGRNRYLGYLISLASHSYKHLRIGLDCANGSAWMMGRAVFEALGAKTYVTGNTPNGVNINDGCGSTHTDRLRRLVKEEGLDLGFAFDGDGDRCIAVDEEGNEINGDHILYILGRSLRERGGLSRGVVVSTVMSNMGLWRALEEAGISSVQTRVGDRYIYECMTRDGYDLGGEQSGHIILRKYATTGDGLLTAIMLTERVVESEAPLSALAAPVTLFPQTTVNLPVTDKAAVLRHPDVERALADCNRRLGNGGRVLLRASGTEPVIRVMTEARDEGICADITETMTRAIRRTGLTT